MIIRITHTTPRVIISHFSSLEYQQIGELEADDFFAGIFDDYGERHQVSEVTHTNDKRHTFFFQDVSQLYKRAYPSLSPLVCLSVIWYCIRKTQCKNYIYGFCMNWVALSAERIQNEAKRFVLFGGASEQAA